MQNPLQVAAVVAAIALAGCGGPQERGGQDTPAPPGSAGPGCGAAVDAVVHHAGGVPAAAVVPLRLVPCFEHTGVAWTYEPTIGILGDGTVVVAPARSATEVDASGSPCMGVVVRDPGSGAWGLSYPTLPGPAACTAPSDPFVHVDPLTDAIFLAGFTGAVHMSVSADRGATWTTTVAGHGQTDHEMVMSGPARTSRTSGYPSVVYECAYSLGALAVAASGFSCNKSLDGGRTFLPGPPVAYPRDGPGNLRIPGNCAGGLDHGIVDREGVLLIPTSACGVPRLAISTDEGTTWRFRTVAAKGVGMAYAGLAMGWTSVAADAAGNLYYLWQADDLLPWLAISRDGGDSWSEPIQVAAPGVVEAALSQVVAGDEGRVALSYLGSRNAPGFDDCAEPVTCTQRFTEWQADITSGEPPGYEATTWDAYVAILPDALDADPVLHTVRVSGDGSDPVIRGPCGPVKCVLDGGEDYVDLRIGPDGTPYAVFVDRCMDACVTGTEPTPKGEVQAAVARLLGGPNLWGSADPNGPYPD